MHGSHKNFEEPCSLEKLYGTTQLNPIKLVGITSERGERSWYRGMGLNLFNGLMVFALRMALERGIVLRNALIFSIILH